MNLELMALILNLNWIYLGDFMGTNLTVKGRATQAAKRK